MAAGVDGLNILAQQARSTRRAPAAHTARTPRARTHERPARCAGVERLLLGPSNPNPNPNQAWNGSNLLGLVYKIVQEKYPPLSEEKYSEDLRRRVPRRRSLTTAPDLHPDPTPGTDPDHRP